MTETLTFFVGFFIGPFVVGSVLHQVAKRRHPQPQYLSGKGKDFANRLAQARVRFGQIANRESIGEARKIANTALKEIDQ